MINDQRQSSPLPVLLPRVSQRSSYRWWSWRCSLSGSSFPPSPWCLSSTWEWDCSGSAPRRSAGRRLPQPSPVGWSDCDSVRELVINYHHFVSQHKYSPLTLLALQQLESLAGQQDQAELQSAGHRESRESQLQLVNPSSCPPVSGSSSTRETEINLH